MKRTPLKRTKGLERRTPLRSGPPRQGAETPCGHCGKPVYGPAGRPRKFCSKTCAGLASRKERTCTICGAKFYAQAQIRRKTCSPECTSKAKSRSKKGARNPNWKGDERKVTRWRSQMAKACVACGSKRQLQLHHAVYEQHIRAAGGDVADPHVSLTLCLRCHVSHHKGGSGLPATVLRQQNIDFAVALFGAPAAYEYLRRRYSGEDPRLEALLA